MLSAGTEESFIYKKKEWITFLKYIALTHKASLFTLISYHDVLRMYGKDWFVFKIYYDPVLKGGEDSILKLCHFCFSNQKQTTTLHRIALISF